MQAKPKIYIPRSLWISTWVGLRARGAGVNESAAVWGGRRNGEVEHVDEVHFLDDCSGTVQASGYHCVPAEALAQFFRTLQHRRQVIIAHIHTHPGRWVGMSPLDKKNPIEFRVGLPAIVLPCYGDPEPSLSISGVHIYQGEGQWRTLRSRQKAELINFT